MFGSSDKVRVGIGRGKQGVHEREKAQERRIKGRLRRCNSGEKQTKRLSPLW